MTYHCTAFAPAFAVHCQVSKGYCAQMFPLRIISLGQFVKIYYFRGSLSQNFQFLLKIGWFTKKKHLFLHIVTKSVEPIFQGLEPIVRHRALKGTPNPSLKLTCFVCYFKIINIFFKLIFQSKLSKELKNGIGILVGQAVFKLFIDQNKKTLFSSITQEPLGLLQFQVNAIFEFLGQFTMRCI